MKEFNSLAEALDYCIDCPICHAIISRGGGDQSYEYETRELIIPLCDRNKSLSHDNLVIQIDSGRTTINLEITPNLDPNIMYAGVSNFSQQLSPQFDYTFYQGSLITGHNVCCQECCLYSYTLQLHVNVAKYQLTNTLLNSETISIEEEDKLHEIRNNYSMNRTEYILIESLEYAHKIASNRHKTLMLPLLSDNLFNPTETLIRLKKLLIFS